MIGPSAARNDRFNYNQAGAESNKEQLLLNIVRLRYGAPIYVMEIGSMVGAHTLTAGGSLSGWWNDVDALGPVLRAIYGIDSYATRQHAAGANLGYTDSPTITYVPVQGEQFADRMMTPIPAVTIIQLGSSGWRMDQLLECCVQWINGVPNAAVHAESGSSPRDISHFRRVAELFRKIQESGLLAFAVGTDDTGSRSLLLHSPPEVKGMEQERAELRELLGYTGGAVGTLKLVPAPFRRAPDELAIGTRPLLGVMAALAQDVAVPPEHVRRGWAAERSQEAHENEARWLKVCWSIFPQPDAFVQVFYKGHWFYIEESDTRSKQTFALVDYLFSLQQTSKAANLPVVTVPAR